VVAVTRARAQADGLTRRLTDLGAKVISAPTISTVALAGDPIDASVYDVVVVTSPNTPPLLLDRIGGDARVLHGVEVAAIGPGTAEALRQIGVVADTVSERAVAEALLETLQDRMAGKRVLIARAEEARDLLPEGLTNAGATVDIAALYRTEYAVPTGDGPLGADAVTFTSASTVRALVAAYPDRDLTGIKGISIGPVTSAAMRELGVGIALEADEHDLDGLISAVIEVLG
jgi:uroporphyrinogen-III synthase